MFVMLILSVGPWFCGRYFSSQTPGPDWPVLRGDGGHRPTEGLLLRHGLHPDVH